jgi:hypothetical protein
MIGLHESRHGEKDCERLICESYWCVICWRIVCWCNGAADEVDRAVGALYSMDAPMEDPGVCDNCWGSMNRDGGPVAMEAE